MLRLVPNIEKRIAAKQKIQITAITLEAHWRNTTAQALKDRLLRHVESRTSFTAYLQFPYFRGKNTTKAALQGNY